MTTGLSTRQLAKREQISTAARRLFLADGFANTSMDAVTAEAGVSKQTLYTYFPTKVDLLAEVLIGSVRELGIRPAANNPPPETLADLRRTLLGLATMFTRSLMQPDAIALMRLILGEAFRVAELRVAVREALPGQLLGLTSRLLQQASDRGLIAITDLDVSSRFFVGSIMAYVALDGFLSVEPAAPPSPAKLELIIDTFLATVAVKP
ncbi:MAG: TetR/AcrR family transcriptional regulator [Propionibacteriales bacterium]|nr:TetR/AcrR family transcriptional regulator [Propionibacteriales bacterium]